MKLEPHIICHQNDEDVKKKRERERHHGLGLGIEEKRGWKRREHWREGENIG